MQKKVPTAGLNTNNLYRRNENESTTNRSMPGNDFVRNRRTRPVGGDNPQSGRMDHVVITMLDSDHHTEEWTFADHGKEKREVFDLRRK
jgi:hypothetical protein